MLDYPIHTSFSDGKNSHEEIINHAVKSKLSEIGFSDHLCLYFPKWAIKPDDQETITTKILSLKKEKEINVKFGFEVDYLPDKEEEIRILLKNIPLDYVIGSVHFIKDWNFDTNKEKFKTLDIDQFYLDYFSLIQKTAQSGLFDIIGHIDLAKKFGYFPSFDLHDLYHKTAKILSESDVAFELNTSGLDKDCKEFYPSEQFLKILFQHNVPVTLGSDTHQVENLGRYFNDAINLLKKTGYSRIARFTNRKRDYINI